MATQMIHVVSILSYKCMQVREYKYALFYANLLALFFHPPFFKQAH